MDGPVVAGEVDDKRAPDAGGDAFVRKPSPVTAIRVNLPHQEKRPLYDGRCDGRRL
jgi:hypothetical protein